MLLPSMELLRVPSLDMNLQANGEPSRSRLCSGSVKSFVVEASMSSPTRLTICWWFLVFNRALLVYGDAFCFPLGDECFEGFGFTDS